MKLNERLIETDNFDFEFLSKLAEKESWRKEIHRPIYHIHKWWANRLGSVFRGIVLGSLIPTSEKLSKTFYATHNFLNFSVFDPFMGSGTTIGEAHKLGLAAAGRDINPVAVESVRVALGPMNSEKISEAFRKLEETVGKEILRLYKSTDSKGSLCDVLYYFWVMQTDCPYCSKEVDLFSSWIVARNAYPNRKPEIQVLCPRCGDIFPSTNGVKEVSCRTCNLAFSPDTGVASGSKAICPHCHNNFKIISALGGESRPKYRLYGKLILTKDGRKQYLKATTQDVENYERNVRQLSDGLREKQVSLPDLKLEKGYNTKQAISYGFKSWSDFFNDRQLLGLNWLNKAISKIGDESVRDVFLTAFSGALEFNNLFASYKGEGTGAVRHMFSHHILKPERTPIEANIWGTPKSSGSFSNLSKNRIDRVLAYRKAPTEVILGNGNKGVVCSPPFSGEVETAWSNKNMFKQRGIYLSCGDSSASGLLTASIDLVVTDPPFFDNVQYSELADFFYAWQKLVPRGFIENIKTTRSPYEVQDADAFAFERKLQSVFSECARVLKEDGLLVFTYHHSRNDGWKPVAAAILNAGFTVINAHPVKSEMSVATPKSQASEPIQLDSIIVCRKSKGPQDIQTAEEATKKAQEKIRRLESAGFTLSKNDKKVVIYGQLLTSLQRAEDVIKLHDFVDQEMGGSIRLPL